MTSTTLGSALAIERDTIAALSTPPGVSGLAVLRLSGPACGEAVRLCLRRRGGKTSGTTPGEKSDGKPGEKSWTARVLHAAEFIDPQASEHGHEVLDQLSNGLRLDQIHASVLESATREFTRLGDAHAGYTQQRAQKGLE